jgi:hypothetical protein
MGHGLRPVAASNTQQARAVSSRNVLLQEIRSWRVASFETILNAIFWGGEWPLFSIFPKYHTSISLFCTNDTAQQRFRASMWAEMELG